MYQRYVQAMPKHEVQSLTNYIKPKHPWKVEEGKARGRDLTLDDTHVLIDITWYRHLSEADQVERCQAL